jgi:hypothetical protein
MLFANINAECRTPTTYTYGMNTQSIDLRQLGNFLRSRLHWSFLEDVDLLGCHPSGFGAAIGAGHQYEKVSSHGLATSR